MFSEHNGIKLEINDRKISGESSNIWKPINILLNNSYINENKSKRNIRKYFELDRNENTTNKNLLHDSLTHKANFGCQGAGCGRGDGQGAQHVYSAVFKIGNQQGPTIEYEELC